MTGKSIILVCLVAATVISGQNLYFSPPFGNPMPSPESLVSFPMPHPDLAGQRVIKQTYSNYTNPEETYLLVSQVHVFDANGRLIKCRMEHFDLFLLKTVNDGSAGWIYAEDRLVEYLDTTGRYNGGFTVKRTVFTYSDSALQTGIKVCSWVDGVLQSDSLQYLLTYDSSSNVVEQRTTMFNPQIAPILSRTQFYYDSANQLVRKLEQRWNQGSWGNYTQEFLSSGFDTTVICSLTNTFNVWPFLEMRSQIWTNGDSTWMNYTRIHFVQDHAGKIRYAKVYSGTGGTDWSTNPSSYYEYVYDGLGTLLGMDGISPSISYDPERRIHEILIGASKRTYIYTSSISVEAAPLNQSDPVLSVFPNPFKPRTEIRVALDGKTNLAVNVYDISGKLVETLYSGPANKGTCRFAWTGRDGKGAALASGIYLVELTTKSGRMIKRVQLLK
jgi:hypothetical protein